MPAPISERLSLLTRLSKAALRDLWKQLYKTAPPCQLRRRLFVSFLAYRIQEQTFGSLSPASHRRLRQLAHSFETDPDSKISGTPRIKPGTRLVRQWRGLVHVVNVERGGYEYRGSRYQSLSEIARLITGTRWSGPLFFGIKNKRTNRAGRPNER